MQDNALDRYEIVIRRAVADDLPFIFSTMLKSLWSSTRSDITQDVFFKEERRIINRLMDSSNVLVGCLRDEASVILCYGIFDPAVIHFVYVKGPFRSKGIGQAFIHACVGNPLGMVATHMTREGRKLWRQFNLVYNPYRLLTSQDDGDDRRDPPTSQLLTI